MRRLGVLAIFMLLLGACSGGEPQETDRRDQATVSATSTPDAAPTTTSSSADAASSTTEAPETATAETTSSPEPTTPEATSEQAAPPPAPTAPAPAPAPADPCSADSMSMDLLGYAGGIEVFVCESGWTYANMMESEGDSEFIAQRVDGVWAHVMGMGSPTCREELLELGAPQSVVVDVTPCDVMYPPEEGGQPSVEDCTIQTTLYGPASADLYQVSCDDARVQWAAADTGSPGSWDEPVYTPAGWECFVAPYETGNWGVAGACTGPAGESILLNL